MGEHMFGVGRGTVKAAVVAKINRIAKKHDTVFVNPTLPGEGARYWFSCPNFGHPFDRATEEAVWGDLQYAGLADENGLAASCFTAKG